MKSLIGLSGAASRPLRLPLSIAALTLCLIAVGCADQGGSNGQQSRADPEFPPAISPYEPDIYPADFVEGVDHPYFPLVPGSTYLYEVVEEGERQSDQITVTNETKEVMGVTCIVVKDVERAEGEIAEKTFDWYAQDRFGNVWYFGEDSTSYENGKPESTSGSWEAGVDGALPGIIMLGDPQVGDRYRQEYYAGEAEDFGEVLELDASIKVPYGSFDNVIVTEEWNPDEPKIFEEDYYAEGIGLIYEEVVKGPSEIVQLVKFERG